MLTTLNRTQEKADVNNDNNKNGILLPPKLPTEVRKQQKPLFFSFFIILCLPEVTLDLTIATVKRGNQMELKVATSKL